MKDMASPQAPGFAPEVLTSAYEALRQRVLGVPETTGSAGGMVLLVQKGLAAWIKACRPLHPLGRPRSEADSSVLPLGLHSELTKLLAGIALYTGPKESRT